MSCLLYCTVLISRESPCTALYCTVHRAKAAPWAGYSWLLTARSSPTPAAAHSCFLNSQESGGQRSVQEAVLTRAHSQYLDSYNCHNI